MPATAFRSVLRAPFLFLAVALQCILLRAALRSPVANGEMEMGMQPQHVSNPSIINDGLVWITPKPDKARHVDWEDEWMMDWKRRHYSSAQRLGCNRTDDTPYDDELLCRIPAYVPARLVPSAENGPPGIPRVIFVSWLDRRLGRAMYTSLLTVLHHNPEYELILFDDGDVDRFVCQNVGSSADDFAIPLFSKVRAGAMRTDIWRLLIMQKYGGVYLDSDISSLGPLPIQWEDTAVSGVGRWSHLPGKTGGLFEHWAMAFGPRHPFIDEAVAALTRNLEHPEYLLKPTTREAKNEDSVTMRLTGPAMYQWTLHSILKRANCKKEDNSYCGALFEPERYCQDMDAFRSYFDRARFFEGVNLDNTITHKVFYPGSAWEKETTDLQPHYDDEDVSMREAPVPAFCSAEAFADRAAYRARQWQRMVDNND